MVYRPGTFVISHQSQAHHPAEFFRERITYDRDNADGTQSDKREGNPIIPRYDVEIGRLILDDIIHLRDIS